MARVKSIFNIHGGLGDYVFYTLNGKPVVRRKAAKKRGKPSAAKEKVKALNGEFAGVSRAAKLFREALAAECAVLENPGLHSALMKVLLAIKNEDPAERGQRTVQGGLATEKGRTLFRDFRFQKGRTVGPRVHEVVRQGSQVTLEVRGPLPAEFAVIELQLDFEKGKFRRAEHHLANALGGNRVSLVRRLRSRKGFMEFWLVRGEGVMGGGIARSAQ